MPIIGGRNLLLDTGRSFTGIGDNSTKGNFNAQGGTYLLPSGKKVSDLYNQYGPTGYLTLSFDWVASGDTISGQFNSEWNSTPWVGIGNSLNSYIKPSITNKSGHFEATVSLNTGDYSTGIATGIRFRQDNLQGNITISNMKLESGSIATDWTPAPEDIDAAIAKAPKLNGNNMYVGDNTYMGTNTFMDGVSLNGKNVVNGIKDTDWKELSLNEGYGGSIKYRYHMGALYLGIDDLTGIQTGIDKAPGRIPNYTTSKYHRFPIIIAGKGVITGTVSSNGTIYIGHFNGVSLTDSDKGYATVTIL